MRELTEVQKKEEIERIQESIDFKYKRARNTLIWQNNKNKGNKKAQNFRYYQRKKFQREEMDRELRAMGISVEKERKQRISVISKTPIRIIGTKAQSSVNKKTNPIIESVRMKMAEEAEKNFLARTEISEGEWKDYQAQRKAMDIEQERNLE